MKTILRRGLLASLALALGLPAFAQNRVFTSQYSFGDSLSDNGNLYALTGRTQPPSPPYNNGRFSNGPVFAELLGNTIVPAAPLSSVGSNRNFAVGGATAGPGSPVPSLAQQIAQYRLQGLPAARTDLFTVLAGANDLIAVLSAPTTPTNPSVLDSAGATTAQAVAASVQTLVGLGAKNIVVAGLPNLGTTPRSLAAGGAGGAGATFGLRVSNAYNSELLAQLRTLAAGAPEANLVYVDVQGVLDRIVLDYRALGYNNATSYFLATSAVSDPNSFVFFDDIHPTAKTHALLAAVIVEELNPEPVLGFSATEGTAALALQGLATSALRSRVGQVLTSARPVGRGDAYVSFNYADANRAADGWRPEFDFTAGVATAGFDVRVSDGFVLGGAIDTGRLNAKVRNAGGNFRAENTTGRLYGMWKGGPVSLAIDADYGVVRVKGIRRTTAFAGFQTAGSTSGDTWGAGMLFAWQAETGPWTLRPWAALRTERLTLDGYREGGVASLNMAFDGQNAKSSSGAVGIDAGTEMHLAGHLARIDFRGAWHGELGSHARTVSGKLADNVTPTTRIEVDDGDGSGLALGAAATMFFTKNWSATVGYEADVRVDDKVASRATISLQTGY
jgi:outer membrane lipase/esterase